MAENYTKLGSNKISRLLFSLSLPSMVSMFANAIYNIIDTIFVGRGVGSLGIAAVAIVLPIIAIISSFAHMIGIGTSTLISRKLGKGDVEEVNAIAGNGFLLIILVGIFFSSLGILFTDPIMRAFGATESILPYAHDYSQIIFIGMLWFPFCVGTSNYLRAEGFAREAMYSMLLGIGVNTVLDYIFIFPLDMGIRGAAWATITGKLATLLYLIAYFKSNRSMISINWRNLKLKKDILKPSLSVGLSGFGMRSSSSFANIILNHILGTLGGDMAIAIFGIIYKTTLFFGMPLFGLNQGMQPIVGYNYGAELYDRVKQTIRLVIRYSLIYGALAVIIFEIFAREIFTLFTQEKELLAQGPRALRIVVIMMWLMGVSTMSMGIHQAMGQAKQAFILAIQRWVLLITPLILILPKLGGLGLDGVWIAFPAADFLAAIISLIILYHTFRRKQLL
ncbi:MAG: MATE family efflux transporter [Bacteroidales bacterium]|nr:MATE family efflux transporter [Bacteroidales bacterium]